MKHYKITITIMTFLMSFLSVGIFAQLKVACVGNSITYGYGFSDPANQSYPGQMQALLGTSGWNVGNFGSSGRTMLKSGGYSYWDDRKYMEALRFAPDYVMIELGTNDSKRWLWDASGSQFKADYKEMVLSFVNNRHSPNPEIWIGLLIPGENPEWDIYNSYIRDKVNPEIKAVALEMGLGLIDLYTPFEGHFSDYYLPDGVHPSVGGAGIIAQKVREMLLMPKPEISVANGTATAPSGYGYQWYFNGVPVAAAQGGQSKDLNVTQSGNYKVSIKINAGNETRIVSHELTIAGESVPVTGITVTPTTATIADSETIQLTANVAPANATNKIVTWSSSNPAVATVNASGVATGISPGAATITATTTDGGFFASSVVNVTETTNRSIVVRAKGTRGTEIIELRVGNTLVTSWRLSKTLKDYTATINNGLITVHFVNDASGRDVQVDYIRVNTVIHQSEDQAENTGFYQNGICGGSYSEWLNCNGYISFSTAGTSSLRTSFEESTDENIAANDITVHPNPAKDGRFFIVLPEMKEKVTVYILGSQGHVLYEKVTAGNRKLEIDERLEAGVYLIKIKSVKFETTKRLIVN